MTGQQPTTPTRPHSETGQHPTPVTVLEEVHGADAEHYAYTRIARTTGHVLRARIRRAQHAYDSHAYAEVLAYSTSTWTRLIDHPTFAYTGSWFHATPAPHEGIDPAAELATLAQDLVGRAATIVTACPTAAQGWSDMDILRALLGKGAEEWLEPRHLADANCDTDVHPVQIIRRPNGEVLVTTGHLPDCALITTNGHAACDNENCYLH